MSTSMHLYWWVHVEGEVEQRMSLNCGQGSACGYLTSDNTSLFMSCPTKAEARALYRYFERVLTGYNADRNAVIAGVEFSDEADETGDFLGVRQSVFQKQYKIRWRLPEGADRSGVLHNLELWLAWVERICSLPEGEEAPHA